MNLDMVMPKFGADAEADEPYRVPFVDGKPQFRHEDEAWIGYDVIVNGAKQFHAASGAELRASARAHRRGEKRRQRKGSAAFARQRRQAEFKAGTRRMQLAILKGEIQVTPAMAANLQVALANELRAQGKAENAADDRAMAVAEREQRLQARRAARFAAGKQRGKDLRTVER